MREKIVYILGAGFSAPLGLPVMSNFLEKSKDMFYKNNEQFSHFGNVFDTIKIMSNCKNYYSANLFNIEEILSILEMNDNFSENSDENSFVNYIIDVINYYTPKIEPYGPNLPGNWNDWIFGKKQLHNNYGFFIASLHNLLIHFYEKRDHSEIFATYEVKLNNNSDCDYSIITLNYDTILENFCTYLKNHYTSSLTLVFHTDCSERNNYPILTKLHGNVSTRKIIPPTWNKNLIDEDIRKSWACAHRLLEQANHIRILGYSLPMTDSYIKFLFKSAVINSKHLKSIDVICLDNTKQEVQIKYDDFITFHKYRFVSANITEYLEQIRNKSKELQKFNQRESSVIFDKLEIVHENFMNRKKSA